MSIKRQSLWNMLPLLIISVVNIFSVRLFLRYLGDEMYAVWNYVILLNGTFCFTDFGLGVVVGRYIGIALGRGDLRAARSYWGTGNLIVIPLLAVMSLIFAGVGILWGPMWFNIPPGQESLLRSCFIAGGFGLFFNYYGQFWNTLSQAHMDFKFIGILRTVITLLQIIPSIGLAFLTRNPLWLLWWGVATGFLTLVLFMWHARRRYNLGLDLRTASFAHAREMASYAGKNFVSLVVGTAFGSIDRLIVSKLAPPADFTHYTVGGNFAARLQSLGTAVMWPVFHNTNRAVGNTSKNSPASIYNETFAFMFEWYLFAAIWIGTWHPLISRLWLGQDAGMKVAPLLTPLVIAYSIFAMATISGAQLASLNRVGSVIGFSSAAVLLAVAGVYAGWRIAGVTGVAYGFLFSRIAYIAQDLFAIRLMKADGWLNRRVWLKVAGQSLVGAFFACAYFFSPSDSFWLIIPAGLHGGIMTAWLLRHQLRKLPGMIA